MKTAVLAVAASLTLPIVAQAASPCEAPEQYVRASKLDVRAESLPKPLLRPYVVGGLAAVAVRQDGSERWLELAVHSVEDARRQLARPAGGADAGPTLAAWRDRVWLRCPGPVVPGA